MNNDFLHIFLILAAVLAFIFMAFESRGHGVSNSIGNTPFGTIESNKDKSTLDFYSREYGQNDINTSR